MSIRKLKKRQKKLLLKEPLFAKCEHVHIYVSLNEEANNITFDIRQRVCGRNKVHFSRKLINRMK